MEIFGLGEIPKEKFALCGGKAKGLRQLCGAGLRIAPGFVIIGIENADDYRKAAEHYAESGLGKVAVRSSATAEDGEDFSNAGQYATFLNVEGAEEFRAALEGCMASLRSKTSESYSAFFSQAGSAKMSVVVQQMVDADTAGVVFSINPVTGAKELLIEAVKGLGESLVSGQASAESSSVPYKKDEDGIVTSDIPESGAILKKDFVEKLSAQVFTAREKFGYELDMEWAVDKNGELFWLQARPVTAVDDDGLDELDGKLGDENTVFTTCNIGEMLPGAVTPLSLSTSVQGIDYGLRCMLIKAGAYKNFKDIPAESCVTSFSNHLFFNLTTIYKMATTIVGAQKGHVEMSICGKQLDTPPLPWKKKSAVKRALNGISYLNFLMARNKAMKKIERLVKKMHIPESDDIAQYYKNINDSMEDLNEATLLHYVTSSHSGAMSSALLQIVQTDYPDEGEAREIIAGLLEDIDNIESVDILRSMRRVAREVLKANPQAGSLSPEQLEQYIMQDKGNVKKAYDSFIARHGHRAIREAELRSKSWKNDPRGLMENILTVIKSSAEEPKKTRSAVGENMNKVLAGKKGAKAKLIKYMINQARAGVHNREYTKARFVRAVDCFKEAYDRLAGMLVEAKALPEKDLIYFLTNDEIGQLIHDKKASLIKQALKRRRILDQQNDLKFKDVYIGKPKAVEPEEVTAGEGSVLSGAPISRGEVKGTARVVKNIEDAKRLKDGEIMVASFTDIGWSPYYSVIGGLVTEVGSALSHGAVVAREYALPLVVNVSNATNIIKTGDYISLNGSRGTVTIIESAASRQTA